MRNELALRNLLLRHLKSFEHHVPEKFFLEAAKTLQVKEESDSYIVNWRISGQQKKKIVHKHTFVFYKRGDITSALASDNDTLRTNNAHAKNVIREVLGVDDSVSSESVEKRGKEIHITYDIVEAILLILILLVFGRFGFLDGSMLSVLIFVEYLGQGRLYASGMFIILALRLPGSAGIGAGVYALLQYLDPNPFYRKIRVLLNVIASMIAFMELSLRWRTPYHFGIFAGLSLLAAVGISLLRSFIFLHSRALPLVFPFLCAGLTLHAQSLPAGIVGLIYCLLSTITAYNSTKKTISGG